MFSHSVCLKNEIHRVYISLLHGGMGVTNPQSITLLQWNNDKTIISPAEQNQLNGLK